MKTGTPQLDFRVSQNSKNKKLKPTFEFTGGQMMM
jgi:hypothetical protein